MPRKKADIGPLEVGVGAPYTPPRGETPHGDGDAEASYPSPAAAGEEPRSPGTGERKRRTRTMTPAALEALAKATEAARVAGPATKARKAAETVAARAAKKAEAEAAAEREKEEKAARRKAKMVALEGLASSQKELAEEIRVLKERWEGRAAPATGNPADAVMDGIRRPIEPVGPPVSSIPTSISASHAAVESGSREPDFLSSLRSRREIGRRPRTRGAAEDHPLFGQLF